MRYYKQIVDGYISAIGTGLGGVEISENEYMGIMSAIKEKPQRTSTTDYLLRTDLTFEEIAIEPVEDAYEAEIDDYTNALNKLGVDV